MPETVTWGPRGRCLDRVLAHFMGGLRDAAGFADPIAFAERVGKTLDPWQRDVLLSRARQIVMNASRQSGKSTVAGLLATHTALTTPGALVLIVAPSQRQAQEMFRGCRAHLSALGPAAPAVKQESALSLELVSGARIVVIPGDERTVRGFASVTLLIIDEASRVLDTLYQALRPSLAVSRGRIVLLSTPNGSRGFFWDAFMNGGTDWHRVRVMATECPRIDPAWLAAERERIGQWWFAQEFECPFVDADSQLYSTADIHAAISSEIVPLSLRGAA